MSHHLETTIKRMLPWIYALTSGRGRKKKPSEALKVDEKWPIKMERSVTCDNAKRAQDELRTLDIEREILSYAIRRLYEAQAEGKISEEERERLAQRYKLRMMKIKETMSRSESLVALYELEAVREDLIKLFWDHFDEINRKIESVRSRIEVKPGMEAPLPSPAPPARGKRGRDFGALSVVARVWLT